MKKSRLFHFSMYFLLLFGVSFLPINLIAKNDPPPQVDINQKETLSSIPKGAILPLMAKELAEIGKKAIPAVVLIKAIYAVDLFDNQQDPFENFNDEFFKRFFGRPKHHGQRPQRPEPESSLGSGVIVSEEGYILTNYHVVRDADKLLVTLSNGEEYDGTVVGVDPRTDLAVMKIEGKKFPYLPFGDSQKLEVLEPVIAIGSNLSYQSSATFGVVSAKGRQNLRINDLEDFIQTDAAINLGNSGGPLLNIRGEIIGINDAILTTGGGNLGISFAIPSHMAEDVMKQLIKSGSVKRGYLGVAFQALDKEMAEALNLTKTNGVLIAEVVKDSAAEKAGMKQGDVVISFDGKEVKNPQTIKNDIATKEPGEKVALKVLRNGKEMTITVTLEKYPEKSTFAKKASQIGIDVAEIKSFSPDMLRQWGYTQETEGILITSIKRGSLAEFAGLKPGMLILQVNQSRVANVDEFQDAMKESENKKHILLLIRFQNTTRFVTIKTP